jgi:hypothetical protein
VSVAFTPGPLEMWTSSLPTNNGGFHLYLADASGRKIAALWGGADEKLANGYLWSAAPELFNGCNALLGLIQLLAANPDTPPALLHILTENHRIAEAEAAVAKARGEQ